MQTLYLTFKYRINQGDMAQNYPSARHLQNINDLGLPMYGTFSMNTWHRPSAGYPQNTIHFRTFLRNTCHRPSTGYPKTYRAQHYPSVGLSPGTHVIDLLPGIPKHTGLSTIHLQDIPQEHMSQTFYRVSPNIQDLALSIFRTFPRNTCHRPSARHHPSIYGLALSICRTFLGNTQNRPSTGNPQTYGINYPSAWHPQEHITQKSLYPQEDITQNMQSFCIVSPRTYGVQLSSHRAHVKIPGTNWEHMNVYPIFCAK